MHLASAIEKSLEVWRLALESCEENIQKWKQHKQEYIELKERLEMFPRKLSHDVMVPLGKVAFMPGRLVHTNEVMVLLGDNWFAGRSAHEAQEIVDRRLKYVEESIKKYEEERQLYVDRLEGVKRLMDEENGGDFLEIREPVEEIRSKPKVRTAHQPSEKKLIASERVSSSPLELNSRTAPKKVSQQDFNTLMDRLDELDREDEETSEDDSDTGVTSQHGDTSPSSSNAGRKVVWRDNVENSEPGSTASSSVATIEADKLPKSILKNREEVPLVGEVPPSPYEQHPKVISSVTEEALCTKVVERLPEEPPASASTTDRPRPLSKFAQERAAKKKQ